MTTTMQTIDIDGSDTSSRLRHGELDEAVGYDATDPQGRTGSRVYFNYDLYSLLESERVQIKRRVIEAMEDWQVIGDSDELQIWLHTTDVQVTQHADALLLNVDGLALRIGRASPTQIVHLLFTGNEAPAGLLDGIDQPVRLDSNADAVAKLDVTALDNVLLYGTRQFRERMYMQLALLPGYPALQRLIAAARERDAAVPRVVFMQCFAGPPQQGEGLELVVDPSLHHVLPGAYTAVLYDPYRATGLDGLTTLARLLQSVYDALLPDMLVPSPGGA